MLSPQSPPPPLIALDDAPACDRARQRFGARRKLPRLLSLQNVRQSSSSSSPQTSAERQPDVEVTTPLIPRSESVPDINLSLTKDDTVHGPIDLNSANLVFSSDTEDRYEWAVLYENQRGLTVFSVPYYSKLSLLPTDPLPFTVPSASTKRSHQPAVSLNEYPLPDGNWRWVSKSWMIDMRTDSGELQPDGFEYNWVFRRRDWRPEVGPFSAGGWVRRRRWIRLMMKPGTKQKSDQDDNEPNHPSALPSLHSMSTTSFGEVTPPDIDAVWKGDTESDWERCRVLMKRIGRDGRQLELWKEWLGYPSSGSKFGHGIAGDKAARTRLVVPPRSWITAVVEKYGAAILRLLIFPDSRAQLSRVFQDSLSIKVMGKPEFFSYEQLPITDP